MYLGSVCTKRTPLPPHTHTHTISLSLSFFLSSCGRYIGTYLGRWRRYVLCSTYIRHAIPNGRAPPDTTLVIVCLNALPDMLNSPIACCLLLLAAIHDMGHTNPVVDVPSCPPSHQTTTTTTTYHPFVVDSRWGFAPPSEPVTVRNLERGHLLTAYYQMYVGTSLARQFNPSPAVHIYIYLPKYHAHNTNPPLSASLRLWSVLTRRGGYLHRPGPLVLQNRLPTTAASCCWLSHTLAGPTDKKEKGEEGSGVPLPLDHRPLPASYPWRAAWLPAHSTGSTGAGRGGGGWRGWEVMRDSRPGRHWRTIIADEVVARSGRSNFTSVPYHLSLHI